jgi:transposase
MDAAAPTQLDALQEALTSARQTIDSLTRENELLRQKLDLFLKRYFVGKKNEAIDPAQLELIMAGLATSATVPPPVPGQAPAAQRSSSPNPERRKPVRQPLPDHLPVERVVIEPAEVQKEPESWKQIGEEITEELDWKPAQFFKRLYIRPKYVRHQEQAPSAAHPVSEIIDAVYSEQEPAVVIAPLPARLIERGFPGPSLLAHVIISKYEDHLPLYRQEKIFRERYGVKLSRATLAEWVEHGAHWLKPIYEAIKKSLLAGNYLQADETPIRYLDPDLPGKSRTGYLWPTPGRTPGREPK